MPAAHTVALMDHMTKEVYADSLEKAIPETARLQKDIKFVGADKREGKVYVQPVQLTRAHGWTLNTSGEAFPLNPPEPSRGDDARVSGSSFVLRDVISYDAAAKALKSPRSFVTGTSYMLENMQETASFVLETQLLHGQRDVGVLESRSNDSGTSQTFVFTVGSFIAALWSGMENGFVQFYGGSSGLLLNNTEVQVTAVDVDTRAVTFTGTEAELDAVNADLANGTKVYLRDTKDAGMVGLISQVSNTGLMFSINAATYSLWKGNTYSAASGALSFAKIIKAVDKPVNRGMPGSMRFYVSPSSWSDCMNDLAALRRFADKAGGSLEQGAEDLVFYGQNGKISIVPHILMKPSEAFGIPTEGRKVIRLGASELTFSMPGSGKGEYWENLPSHAGYGTRCYWNQAVLLSAPSKGVLINGIVNS